MGTNNGSRVASAKPKVGGGLYWAPPGTTLPTDSTTALPAAAKCLGPISDAGVRPTRETNIEKVKEWDGSTLVQLLSDESRTFELDLYGVHDVDVLTYIFGASNVTVTPPTASVGTKLAVVDRGGQCAPGVLILEMVHKGVKQRKVLPIGQGTVTGEKPYIAGGLRGYTLEIEATKDAAGAFVYEYSELDDKTA